MFAAQGYRGSEGHGEPMHWRQSDPRVGLKHFRLAIVDFSSV
jgi:hypothetical protein